MTETPAGPPLTPPSARKQSRLLKLARTRDDTELALRVAAALTLRAEAIQGWQLPPDTRTLVDWLVGNPMSLVRRAVPFMVLNPTIAEKIIVDENGAISSDAVEDADIEYVVEQEIDAIATAWKKHENS